MHSYLFSFLLVISLSVCSYHVSGIAKEKKVYQFGKPDLDICLEKVAKDVELLDPKTFTLYGMRNTGALDLDLTSCKNFVMNFEFFPANGGGLRGKNLNITHNTGPVVFQDNAGYYYGGGALWADTCTIANNPQGVLFLNNHSETKGGAIHTFHLYIYDNGPVLFLNNSSTWGGALQNNVDNTQIKNFYLSADYGDIIFNGNSSMDGEVYRNAIHSAHGGMKLRVGARKNQRVLFYDPVEHQHPSDHGVIFNYEPYHLGTVVFSGALVNHEASTRRDYLSTIRNTSSLANGVLAIEERAILTLYNFSQTGGTVRLGNRGVIISEKNAKDPKTTVNCTITITKLALNLPSLCKEGAQPPKIWIYPTVTTTNNQPPTYAEDDNPKITVAGALTLLDSDNQDPYDSVDLSNNITKLPLLYLCENTNKQIDTTNLNIGTLNDTTHYGHQGVWKPYWESTTTVSDTTSESGVNTKHRYLYADWTRTGYTVNPKYNTPLITNTLWQSLYSTMSGMRSLPHPIENSSDFFEFSGQGLGISITQKDRSKKHGFRMESGGYAIANANRRFSLTFAQQFSRVKEKVTSNKISSKNYFLGIKFPIPWINKIITATGSLAYNYGDHKAKHSYKEDKKASQGFFYSRGLAASLHCSLRASPKKNHFIVAPFIEATAFRASLSHCQEIGDFPRYFSTHTPLTTITLPLGMVMQWAHDTRHPKQWKLQLAYQPMIYKKAPQVRTTLLASNGTWLSSGTPISRNTLTMNVNNTTQLRDNLKIFLKYQGEISYSTFANYLTTGSSLTF
ncbi:polymorphic outer membrane protein middle domain-containing protein [Chlamydia vaughanii]|uniref:polymorphic outer membrane protein middle domain-containing protein n=1 Tax=Chlamydia vaughanii TaxID=3112552 RepID=UPI0032B2ECE2